MHKRVFNYLSNTQDEAIISEKNQNATFMNKIKTPMQPTTELKQVKKQKHSTYFAYVFPPADQRLWPTKAKKKKKNQPKQP